MKEKIDLTFMNTSIEDLASTLHCAEVNNTKHIISSAVLQKALELACRRGKKTKARLIQRYIKKMIKKERME